MHSDQKTFSVRVPLLVIILVSALLPAAALAGKGKPEFPLPEPKTTRIEIPGSLGGISLGQTQSETVKQWGNDARCGKSYCHWGASPNSYPDKGEADIGFEDGVVNFVSIGWSPTFIDGKRPIRRSITKFHTAEGIRLKSTAKEAKKAYPDVKPVDVGHGVAYKFESPESTMYIHVGQFVERIEIRPPGFKYSDE